MSAPADFGTEQLVGLFAHFLSLAAFATGGAIALASDMHRYVVDEHGYLTHTQFLHSIALAQAAPGPNVLFVTVLGWQIAGLRGALATTLGLSLPALVFPLAISRLSRLAQFERLIRALQLGLGPLAIGLMTSTAFLLVRQSPVAWQAYAIMVATFLTLAFTRLPPLVPIAVAGVIGVFVPW